MEKGKNIIIMANQNMKEDILAVKKMENVKNIIMDY